MITPEIEKIIEDRADWLVDAVATAAQDRRLLRGEDVEDTVLTEAIYLNGAKAIRIAIQRALEVVAPSTRREHQLCATDGCGRPATQYFQAYDVGSYHCDKCATKITAMRAASHD